MAFSFRLLWRCVKFLGAYAKLRKVTISFVMSVCWSVRPHGKTQLPLVGCLCKFICEYFSKNCIENAILIKMLQEQLYLTWGHKYIYDNNSPIWEWEMFQTKCVVQIKTHNLYYMTFSKNLTFCEIMWKNIVSQDRPHMTIHYASFSLHAGYLRLQIHFLNM